MAMPLNIAPTKEDPAAPSDRAVISLFETLWWLSIRSFGGVDAIYILPIPAQGEPYPESGGEDEEKSSMNQRITPTCLH